MKKRLLSTASVMLFAATALINGCKSEKSNDNSSLLEILLSMGKSYVATHFAGSDGGPACQDGAGTIARFNQPYAITSDGTDLYLADSYNHTIRKIVIATGEATTFAGKAGEAGYDDGARTAARFYYPHGITNDGTCLYVADSLNHTIRRIVIATGRVTTIAGTAGTSDVTDSAGAAARFYRPMGIRTDGTNLYVADTYNHTIRKIVIATREVTTLAGSAGDPDILDGTGTDAHFSYPIGITGDSTYLYVADSDSHTIRRIEISSREVDTFAGDAGEDGSGNGIGTAARFDTPQGITLIGSYLYVADSGNHMIRRINISTREVSTYAGSAGSDDHTDGNVAMARFYGPSGITVDSTALYISDTNNHTIRRIVISTSEVTTLAGKANDSGNDSGTGVSASFNGPRGITSDGTNLYVTNTNSHTIRRIVIANGEAATIAGTAGSADVTDGTGADARFDSPDGITTDGTNLYVADTENHTIRKIVIASGEVTTFAGGKNDPGTDDEFGGAARFNTPRGIVIAGDNLYVADTNNHTIRKIVIATREVTTLAGTAGSTGTTNATGAAARFTAPRDVTTDGANLYVTDTNNHTIRKIVIATREVTTCAGTAGTASIEDGVGTPAGFNHPDGITCDGTSLYVTDNYRTIRKIVISSGRITTIAGNANIRGAADGAGAAAWFNDPSGIVYDSASCALFLTDSDNNCIRKIE